jgi:hypothetical protein
MGTRTIAWSTRDAGAARSDPLVPSRTRRRRGSAAEWTGFAIWCAARVRSRTTRVSDEGAQDPGAVPRRGSAVALPCQLVQTSCQTA